MTVVCPLQEPKALAGSVVLARTSLEFHFNKKMGLALRSKASPHLFYSLTLADRGLYRNFPLLGLLHIGDIGAVHLAVAIGVAGNIDPALVSVR